MKLFALILTLLTFCLTSNAHDYFQNSERQLLNKSNGLCNNTVTDIDQDAAGILWFSTDAGISRYDGTTFYSRTIADLEPVALANLAITSDGLLWSMAKYRPRICCFNRLTGHFLDVRVEGEDILPRILNIRVVDDLLMAVTPEALYRMQTEVKGDEVVLTPLKAVETHDTFLNLYGQGEYVYMWTAGKELVLYHLPTAKITRIPQEELLIRDLSHIRHSYLGSDHLWICSDHEGLICYSLQARKARRITITEPENQIREARIFDIAKMGDTDYIVSTQSSILKMTFDSPELTRADYRITDLTPDREVYGGLLNERINCIHFDRTNRTLWVGTQGGGVMKLRMWGDYVFHIPAQKEMGKLNHIAQGAQGYIWISSETGLYRSDSRDITPTLHFTRWQSADAEGNHCLFRDAEANLWVGNEQGEVRWMNTHTGEELTYRPTQSDGHTPMGAIRQLCLDSYSRLWLAGDRGLAVFDPKTRATLTYKSYKESGFTVNCLCEDSDGDMWLGTDRGLRLCHYQDGRLASEGGYEQQIGMNPGLVRSLYINRYNQLFAAFTNKIITLDGKTKQVTGHMLVNRELMDGHIQCMVDDRNGNTWMGSNTGISTYNNRTGQTFHYDSSNNYFDVAYLSDGELIWATSTGLLYFAPQKIKEETTRKHLRVSAIEVNNIRLMMGREINGQEILTQPAYLTDHLKLNYNNNVVITFTNMRYSSNTERVYYRLLPDQKEWTTAWNNRVALNGLRPGKYTLEVRPPMPFDGETATLTLTLEVGRHWALTIWALLAYLLLFGLMLLAIRAYYHRRMARRERHLSEKRSLELALDEEKGKREEVMRSQQARDSIRQTLAQEMRSPLAMAIVPLKEIVSDALTPEDTRQKAQIAYHNAIYLQDICNQILRIYQQEATENTLNAAPYTVSELADEAVRTSRELLNVSDIRLDYDRTKRLTDTVWADRRKVVFVLGNVLSNAYRRISYTGTVEMRVGLAELHGQACCEFVCRDRSAKEPHPEIGLEVMQHIALIHGGDLTFNHTADEGTAVHLYLPLDKEHLEGKPYVHFVEPELPEVQGEEPLPPSATDDDENAALYDENQPVRLQTVNPETKYKVLVIEDNNDILLYMKVLLSNKYNVLLAMDGEEGIRVARKEEPDLILTDVMMPVMDGLECCRILKNDLKTCHIPVIMLTALTSDEDVMKGLETGADDYILKPFNPEILRSKIRNLIQSRVDLKRVYTRLLMTSAPADDNGPTEADKQAEDPFIAQIMELVNTNLQSPDFSVKRLAERMNMSQPTLYRRVKQLTNFTIVELIRGARLKRAAELLRTKRYSVQDVAERVGYNDVPTFRKHFIDLYGTTPSTFNS